MRSAQRQALILLCIGVLAAAATLLGPQGLWGPVDVGAVGAAAFLLVLLSAVWLVASRGDQVFPDDMSLAERRAWVGLVFIAIILLSFARQLWARSLHGIVPERIDQLFAHHFMHRLITLIVAWLLISRLLARHAGGLECDERDLGLRHRAPHSVKAACDWSLTLIVIACIFVLVSIPSPLLAWWLAPIVLANLLIGLLIAKSLVEHLVLTYAYRAGRA
jgi:hypothetical protein